MQDFLPFGAVLKITREDTTATIEQCLVDMKNAGMNTAVIWPAIYWWEDKTEGYPFNTGKQILKLAQKHDMKLIMELAGQLSLMEYIPDHLMKKEYYPVDVNGNVIYAQDSFGYLNYFHPEVESYITDYLKQAADAYKDSPALFAYDIFNETLAGSYDAYTMAHFQSWLREKYVTIDRLNNVWERYYTDFTQITFSPWMWMSIMPVADFQAFQRAITPIVLKKWYATLRAADPRHMILADNVHSMAESPSYMNRDDFALNDVADRIGMSFYPKGAKSCFPYAKRWQIFDGFYAASNREGFYVAEMQTHTQAMFNPTTAVDPRELKQWCFEAYAAGSRGLIYWMWRPFTKGLQTLGRGLVDYRGQSTPRLEAATQFGKVMAQLGNIKPLQSKIAIIYDQNCDLFQQCYTKAYSVEKQIYHRSLQGAYKAMLSAGVRCDVTTINHIASYDVIILSNHIALGNNDALKLAEFVKQGGIVICDGKFGVVDDRSMLHAQLPGGDFCCYTGQEFIDSLPYEGEFSWNGTILKGSYSKEIMAVTDGTVVAQYNDGAPAIVRKESGSGCVITINSHYWYGYQEEGKADPLASILAETYHLQQINVPSAIKARICENEKSYVLFLFNYTDSAEAVQLQDFGFNETVTVPAKDVLVLERRKQA